MSMVSLKRYLNRTDEEGVLRQVVALLLEKVGASAAVANDADSAAFRDDMNRFREQFVPEATPDHLLLAAGSAMQALDGYNKGITRVIQKQGVQLQSVIGMMTETVAMIGGQHVRSAERLKELSDGLERTGAIKDFETLKSCLGDYLKTFKEETLRQKQEADSLIQTLRQDVQRCSRGVAIAGGEDLDQVTGLHRADAGIKAMHEAVPQGKRRYVVTMVVGRIQSINARFGQEAGDRILTSFGSFVEQQLGATDRLFRWTGPAFVALLERTESLDNVRVQIKRMLEARLEENFEVGERSVLIPVTAAWTAFQLITTVATAQKQIQGFIAGQASSEYL
jgi:GGDEF domain-containing protein